MPATDWREITFSRARLRPNDGKDPHVRELRSTVRELAKRKDVEAYARAKSMLEIAEEKERSNYEKLKKDEVHRQAMERKNMAEALKMKKESFEAEWAFKRQEMEEICAKKLQDFEDKAEGQRKALELSIQKTPMPPVKYSSIVRDDRTIEHKNARAETPASFELAIRYNKSLAGQKKLEEERHSKAWDTKVAKRRSDLEDRLAAEQKTVLDAVDRIKLAFEFQYKIATERMQQKGKNLHHDVEHALALEFVQKQEVRKSLTTTKKIQKSYASRPSTSATFMGRNLMEKAGHGSLDVPSVCKMHWDIPDTPRYQTEEKGKKKRPSTAAH